MCNSVHRDGKTERIPLVGEGYKVFNISPEGTARTMVSPEGYVVDSAGWVTWAGYRSTKGFCFFLQKREAARLYREWIEDDHRRHTGYRVLKIFYREGLVEQEESNIFSGNEVYRVALARRFRLAGNRYKLEVGE